MFIFFFLAVWAFFSFSESSQRLSESVTLCNDENDASLLSTFLFFSSFFFSDSEIEEPSFFITQSFRVKKSCRKLILQNDRKLQQVENYLRRRKEKGNQIKKQAKKEEQQKKMHTKNGKREKKEQGIRAQRRQQNLEKVE